MESASCVYQENIVIHELSQGIQMAQQLRDNLYSPETKKLLIKNILSSYDKALSALVSSVSVGQPPAPTLPACCLPESSISKKRKGYTTREDQSGVCKVQKYLATEQVQVLHQDLGGDTVFSSSFVPSTSSGVLEDIDQFRLPNNYEDELWQVCSSAFISPTTSESNCFTEWGSSSSLDFMAAPTEVDHEFIEFINSFF